MASTGAKTLSTHEANVEIVQPSHSFSSGSDLSSSHHASVRSGTLAKISKYRDQTGIQSEYNLSVHGAAQMGCYEIDPLLVLTKICDPNIKSQTLVIVDEVRLILDYRRLLMRSWLDRDRQRLYPALRKLLW